MEWGKEIIDGAKKLFGIEIGLIFAGIAGAFVSLPKKKALTFVEKVFVVFSGGAIANYLTPVFADWMNAGDQSKYGMGFLVGYLGLKSIELSIDYVKSKFKQNDKRDD